MTFSRRHFPSKARPQRTAVGGKQRFQYIHLAEIPNWYNMGLVSSPNGSIFDQRAHICAEVFDTKFSLSAILLFEREVNLLLYESLWLDVYTLLTFYSVKKQSRTRFLAKLQTYILQYKMQKPFFWRPSGTCPEAIERVSRHLRMALACL